MLRRFVSAESPIVRGLVVWQDAFHADGPRQQRAAVIQSGFFVCARTIQPAHRWNVDIMFVYLLRVSFHVRVSFWGIFFSMIQE
jgi:hypothetical protein